MTDAFRVLAGVRRTIVAVLVILVAVGAAAGPAAAQAEPAVIVQPNGALGPILTDPDGMTLYLWEGDVPGMSNCTGQCAAVWPPYTIEGDPLAPPGFPGALGLIERDDGSMQVTLNDAPLYYFSGDAAPGDANGQGLAGFGAPWHVVALGAPPSAAPQQSYGGTLGVPGLPQLGPAPSMQPPASSSSSLYATPAQMSLPPGYAGPLAQPAMPYAPPPPVAPAYATNGYSQTLTVQGPPNGIVSVSWVGRPSATSYRIYTTPISQPLNLSVQQTVQQPAGQLITNALVTTLAPGGTYLVQIRAVDPSGQESPVAATAFSSPALSR